MIPKTFEQWKKCIIVDCKIELTREFAVKRLSVYQDKNNKETKKFIALYGAAHVDNIISWLKQVG